ncbi:MAG: gamma carbonic anhydrase family protein, partial [Planctomycetota bacterium]
MTQRKETDCHPRPHQIAESAFVAENATVLGDVHLDDDVSIWFGAVLRGDVEP